MASSIGPIEWGWSCESVFHPKQSACETKREGKCFPRLARLDGASFEEGGFRIELLCGKCTYLSAFVISIDLLFEQMVNV